jgi:hypothetical protein
MNLVACMRTIDLDGSGEVSPGDMVLGRSDVEMKPDEVLQLYYKARMVVASCVKQNKLD